MKRGEIWWAELPKPAGRRPVILLSRDEAYEVSRLVTVAPVTTRVANLDTVTTIPKDAQRERLTVLSRSKMTAVDAALKVCPGPSEIDW